MSKIKRLCLTGSTGRLLPLVITMAAVFLAPGGGQGLMPKKMRKVML